MPYVAAIILLVATILFTFIFFKITRAPRQETQSANKPSKPKPAPNEPKTAEVNSMILAEQCAKSGQYDRAMQLYEKGGFFTKAAEIAVLIKDLERAAVYFEKAGELTKAANIYFDLKKYPKAEQILETLGKTEDLGDIYKRRGEHILAAKAYLKLGKYEEAAAILEATGDLIEAADALNMAYENAKQDILGQGMDPYRPLTKRLGTHAAELFKKTNQQRRAAKLYLELQLHPEAAYCCVELKDYQKAAEIFEMIGNLDEAEKYWKLAGNPSKAIKMVGERFVSEGRPDKAIEKFEEVGEFARAAEIYLEAQQPEKAADLYEKAGEFAIAASFFRHAGKLEKAGHCFEQAGELRQAIECYEKSDLFEREISLRKQLGDYVGVAKKLYERGLQKDALSMLSKVHETDTSFKSAQSLKGKIYLSIGDAEHAEVCLRKSLALAHKIGIEDLDTIYQLSLLPNKPDARDQALRMLEEFSDKSLVESHALSKLEDVRRLIQMDAAKGSSPFNTSISDRRDLDKGQRYEPVEEVGRGGMGIVYKAQDKVLDRVVALKILPASLKKNARAVNTFLREAKAAASLSHPNIVTIHDTGVQNGDYYIAMEYIEGHTIKDLLKVQKKFPLKQVLEILRQLLEGLEYAHSKDVVHRDLTTNNLMYTKYKVVKIMDFGLAKVMKDLLNEQSIIGGTPSFMSPEQTLGKPIDRRTDIYSLGICVFEMLLGELPFQKGDLGYHHLHTPPPIPKSLNALVPEILNDFILKCLEKAPEQRYQSIQDIKRAITGL